MQDHNKILQRELTHVYWMGGSPCAGKSSIADILAATYGLSLYRADEAYFRHEKVVDFQRKQVRKTRSSMGWFSMTSAGATRAARLIRALPPIIGVAFPLGTTVYYSILTTFSLLVQHSIFSQRRGWF